jgi:hypothetical protein
VTTVALTSPVAAPLRPAMAGSGPSADSAQLRPPPARPLPAASAAGATARPRIATSPVGRGVAEIGVMKDIGAASTVLWQLSARFPAVFDGLQPVLVPKGPEAWSVRVAGFASLRDAEDLCRQIQNGRQSCVASAG